jgi:hypothetical protein
VSVLGVELFDFEPQGKVLQVLLCARHRRQNSITSR